MDWLGGLSNIKGQLSNITKDLLSEGTDDLNDSKLQLDKARVRIIELESVCDAQKNEILSLKTKQSELEIQLESAQLRLDHASDEYNKHLSEKDNIIQKLQSSLTSERGEPEGQSATSIGKSFSTTNKLTRSDPGHYTNELASEDYHSVAAESRDGSASWQELRDEVALLRMDVAKWRKIARQSQRKLKDVKSADGSGSVAVNELEKEIEDLKHQLQEADEARQMELTALRETHEDRISTLYGQLREAESEVTSVRSRLDEAIAHTVEAPVVCPPPSCAEIISTNLASDVTTGKKKSRNARKKTRASGVSQEIVQMSAPSSVPPEPATRKATSDSSVQTDLVDSSMETSSEYEKVDFAVRRTREDAAQQTSTSSEDVETQVELPFTSDSAEAVFASVQTTSARISPTCFADSDHHLTGIDDDRSQISDTSDISVSSRHFEEMVLLLSDEMQTYQRVVDQVVSTVMGQSVIVSSTDAGSQSSLADSTGVLCEAEPVIGSVSTTITQRLSQLQSSLRNRRKKLAAIRKANEQKRNVSDTSFLDIANSMKSSISGVEISLPDALATCCPETPTPAEATWTELDTNQWCEEMFPELDSQLSDGQETDGSLNGAPVMHCRGDNKKTQTMARSESSETLVCDLQNTIQELEGRLAKDALDHQATIDELEALIGPLDRVKCMLHDATKRISSRFSSLSLSDIPSELKCHSSQWPPVDPVAQVSLLVTSETAAYEELNRLSGLLETLQDSIRELQTENDQLRSSNHSPYPPTMENVQDSNLEGDKVEPDLASLARHICVSLDPDFNNLDWDPEQWDVSLYEILKPRFVGHAEADDSQSADDRVIQLTAEVVALRDVLAQHTAFRTQAERDLRQLLATAASQRDQLDAAMDENTLLKSKLGYDGPDELDVPAVAEQHFEQTTLSEEHRDHHSGNLERRVRSFYCRVAHIAEEGGDEDAEVNRLSVTELFERINSIWIDLEDKLGRIQSMNETVVAALHQKHSESQVYHTELQRVYSKLIVSEEKNRSLQQTVDSLQSSLRNHELSVQTAVHETSSRYESVSVESMPHQQADVQTAESGTEPDSKELTLVSELTRLRAHLVEMEESYTTEALKAEAREIELRQRLNEVEPRLLQYEEAGKTTEQRVLRAVSERDEARADAEKKSREIASLRSNLTNLQSALDGFQQNQQSQVMAETERIRLQLQHVRDSESKALADLGQLRAAVEGTDELKRRLKEETDKTQYYCSQLERAHIQVEQRDAHIDSLRTRLAQMAVDTDSKIDKILMKNVLLSYLQMPSSQRSSGLRVLGSLLQFSEEEYAKIGSEFQGLPKLIGWIRNAVSVLPPGPPKDVTLSSSYPDKVGFVF